MGFKYLDGKPTPPASFSYLEQPTPLEQTAKTLTSALEHTSDPSRSGHWQYPADKERQWVDDPIPETEGAEDAQLPAAAHEKTEPARGRGLPEIVVSATREPAEKQREVLVPGHFEMRGGKGGGVRVWIDPVYKESSVGETLREVPQAIIARGEEGVGGVKHLVSYERATNARKEIWQTLVLPQAYKNLQEFNASVTDDRDKKSIIDMPEVVEAAKRVGVRPDVFTRDWPSFVNKSPDELTKIRTNAISTFEEQSRKEREARAQISKANQQAKDYRPDVEDWSAKGIMFDTLTSVPDLLLAAGTTAVAGPEAGLGVLAATTAPTAYADAIDMGADPSKAQLYAVLYSVAETVPETGVLEVLARTPGGKRAMKSLLGRWAESKGAGVAGAAGLEGASEMITQALETGIDSGVLDKDISLKDALEQIARAGVIGGAMGGSIHAGGEGIGYAKKKLQKTPQEEKPAVAPSISVAPDEAPGEPDADAADLAKLTQLASTKATPEEMTAAGALEGDAKLLKLQEYVDRGIDYTKPAPPAEKPPVESKARPDQDAVYENTDDQDVQQAARVAKDYATADEISAALDKPTAKERLAALQPLVSRGMSGGETAPADGLEAAVERRGEDRPAPKKTTFKDITATGTDGTHEALEAVRDGKATPEQVKQLEDQKLVIRNETNAPRLLPAGRRVLAKAAGDVVETKVHGQAIEVNVRPSEAQKEAGNYLKGDVNLFGLKISIENPKGSKRTWSNPDTGESGERTMHTDYGFVKSTEGADGDEVDVHVGPNEKSKKVFVINQLKKDGSFDETKSMLGYNNIEQAKSAYLRNYQPGWKGMGDVVEMTTDEFKDWVKHGDTKSAMPKNPSQVQFSKTKDNGYDINRAQDGKIADATGKPITVYHGTNHEFGAFREDDAHFFTESKELAGTYGKKLIAAHVTINNPAPHAAVVKAARKAGLDRASIKDEYDGVLLNAHPDVIKELKRQGYDGWVGMDSSAEVTDMDEEMTYVPFSSKQIERQDKKTDHNSDAKKFASQLENDLGLGTLSVHIGPAGHLKIDMLEIPREKRNQGLGSKAMEALTKWADERGIPMSLQTAEKDAVHGTTSKSRLKKFYKRFGFRENKGRSKDFTTRDNMLREPKKLQFSKTSRAAAFRKWFGKSKVVDDQGKPLVVYHGTNADFSEFDRDSTNPEADMGKGFYFSNTPEDVSENYAVLGPDMTQRIELAAERIQSNSDEDISMEDAKKIAKEKLRITHGGSAIPVFLKMENPAVIGRGGQKETYLDYERNFNEDEDGYAKPSEGWEERGLLVDFIQHLRNAADEYHDGSLDSLISSIMDEGMDDGLRLSRVFDLVDKDETFGYYTDDEGTLVSKEILREALERTGFDGIIDYTVNQKFGSERRAGKTMSGMHSDTTHFIVFSPTQIKSAIGNNGEFGANADILKSVTPFFSAVERFIEKHSQKSATPDQWIGILKNAPGIKPEEMEWLGLTEWLEAQKTNADQYLRELRDKDQYLLSPAEKKRITANPGILRDTVTRDQILEYIRANKIEVTDVVKDGVDEPSDISPSGRIIKRDRVTKYGRSNLVTPGGSNYKELLLTLPQGDGAGFRSSHFAEHENVLAHVRFNERTDADGKKVLFIEEIQSDWHQKGRKEGYQRGKNPKVEDAKAFFGFSDSFWNGLDADSRQAAFDEMMSNEPHVRGGVPNAPFKTTWPELALKRMIRWAAEHGFDRIAWTTGAMQADRYNLATHVRRVITLAGAKGRRVLIDMANGSSTSFDVDANGNISTGQFYGNDLSAVIGEDLSSKIMAVPKDQQQEFSGESLSIGGEGMKGFYDKILVQAANKLVKKWGSKVGSTSLTVPSGRFSAQPFNNAFMVVASTNNARVGPYYKTEEEAAVVADRLNGEGSSEGRVHSIDVTPEMRDAAMSGLPLFSKTGGRGITPESAHATIARVTNGYQTPNIRVVKNASKLPYPLWKKLQADGGDMSAVDAFYDGERIWILADNIIDEAHLVDTIYHELVVHYGLRQTMSPEDLEALQDGIWRDMEKAVRDVANRNGLDISKLDERRLAAEEVMAYMAGKVIRGEKLEGIERTWWEAIKAAIQRFFDRLGISQYYDETKLAKLILDSNLKLQEDSGAIADRLQQPAMIRSQKAPLWYSPMLREFEDPKLQAIATPDEWQKIIANKIATGKIREAEMRWYDLREWLKTGTIGEMVALDPTYRPDKNRAEERPNRIPKSVIIAKLRKDQLTFEVRYPTPSQDEDEGLDLRWDDEDGEVDFNKAASEEQARELVEEDPKAIEDDAIRRLSALWETEGPHYEFTESDFKDAEGWKGFSDSLKTYGEGTLPPLTRLKRETLLEMAKDLGYYDVAKKEMIESLVNNDRMDAFSNSERTFTGDWTDDAGNKFTYRAVGVEGYRFEVTLNDKPINRQYGLVKFAEEALSLIEREIRQRATVAADTFVPQYDQYTLPVEKQQYKEKLLTWTNREASIQSDARPQVVGFSHGHFSDDTDFIAHVRSYVTTTTDGKKILILDELQSDWHQEIRDAEQGIEAERAAADRFKARSIELHEQYVKEDFSGMATDFLRDHAFNKLEYLASEATANGKIQEFLTDAVSQLLPQDEWDPLFNKIAGRTSRRMNGPDDGVSGEDAMIQAGIHPDDHTARRVYWAKIDETQRRKLIKDYRVAHGAVAHEDEVLDVIKKIGGAKGLTDYVRKVDQRRMKEWVPGEIPFALQIFESLKIASDFDIRDQKFNALNSMHLEMYEAKRGLDKGTGGGKVNPPPLQRTWPIALFQWGIREAAEQQLDGIAITPGSVHGARWGATVSIPQLNVAVGDSLPDYVANPLVDEAIKDQWENGGQTEEDPFVLLSYPQGGKHIVTKKNRMAGWIGKSAAARVIEGLGDKASTSIRSAPDSTIWWPKDTSNDRATRIHHGSMEIYNSILPNQLNDWLKKWKSKFGSAQFQLGSPTDRSGSHDATSLGLQRTDDQLKDVFELPTVMLTPEIKTEAVEKGFPLLFSRKWYLRAKNVANRVVQGNQNFDLPDPSSRSRAWNYLVFKLQDKFVDLFKTQQEAAAWHQVAQIPDQMDAYLQQTLFHGRAEDGINEHKQQFVEPLIEMIKKSGYAWEDVEDYLYARHAPEANAHLLKINGGNPAYNSGMTDQESQQVMAQLGASGDITKLHAIGAWVDQMTKWSRDQMVMNGLEDLATIQEWEKTYQHYVPLKGWKDQAMDPDVEQFFGMPKKGKGFDTGGKLTKQRMGRTSRAATILANVVAQAQATIILSEKAKVGRAFYDFVKQTPSSRLWSVDEVEYMRYVDASGLVRQGINPTYQLADNVIRVKTGGKTYHITLNDEIPQMRRIAQAMKNLSADQIGPLIGFLHRINRFLSSVNTSLNPEFTVTNALRDIQTALINLGEQDISFIRTKILKDWRKAWWSIRRAESKTKWIAPNHVAAWAASWAEFKHEGGKVGWIDHYKSPVELDRVLRRMLGPDGMIAWTAHGIRRLGDFVENENLAVENALRLSTYVNLVDAGVSKQRAAEYSKNLTVNFNRKGEAGTWINSLYLFYNAGAQGTARMWMAAKNPRVRRFMYGIIIAGMAREILNRMLGGDDDDDEPLYDKIPEGEKERNMIFMLPESMRSTSASGEKTAYLKIALPYGYNVLDYAGQKLGKLFDHLLIGNARRYDPIEEAALLAGSMVHAFSPLGDPSTSVGQFIAPTAMDPLVQVSENRAWHGGKLMPDDFPGQPPSPDSQKFFRSTPAPYKEVAAYMNSLTGGTEVTPGALDISPETMQLFAETAGGGLMRFVTSAIDAPTKNPEERELRDVPFLRKVLGGIGDRQTQDLFMDHLVQVERARNEIDSVYEMGIHTDEGQKRLAYIEQKYPVASRMIRDAYPNFGDTRSDDDRGRRQVMKELKDSITPAKPISADAPARRGRRHAISTDLKSARQEIARLEARTGLPDKERREKIEAQKKIIRDTMIEFNKQWNAIEDSVYGERNSGKLIERLGPLINGKSRKEMTSTLKESGLDATASLISSLPPVPDRFAREFYALEATREPS